MRHDTTVRWAVLNKILAVHLSRSRLYNLLCRIAVTMAQLVLTGVVMVAAASMKALAIS